MNTRRRDPETGRFISNTTTNNNSNVEENNTMRTNNNTTTNATTNNTTNGGMSMRTTAAQNRMETLANAGFDTSKFFNMSLWIPMGANVNLTIDGQTVQLTGNVQQDMATAAIVDAVNSVGNVNGVSASDIQNAVASATNANGDVHFDTVAQQILGDGYVNNGKLFRRWICSQVLRMINYTSWNGRDKGYDAYVKCRYDYAQTFKMTIDELHRIASMLKDGDEMGNEALYFFNKDVVVNMMYDYLRKLKKYIKHVRQNRVRKHHGKEYVRLATYGDVYVTELHTNVYSKIEFYIDAIKRATSLSTVEKVLRDFMDNGFNKLPYTTSLSSDWKDAFKGNGAYFTLKNLVRFHYQTDGNPFVIENYKTGEILSRQDADKYLTSLLDEYKGCGWKFMEVLKRALEINDFEFVKSIGMCNNQ